MALAALAVCGEAVSNGGFAPRTLEGETLCNCHAGTVPDVVHGTHGESTLADVPNPGRTPGTAGDGTGAKPSQAVCKTPPSGSDAPREL
jgi:hypothetical protein